MRPIGLIPRRVNAVSVPLTCEVCRKEPGATLVADFIFACDSCAERIATACGMVAKSAQLLGRISRLIAKRGLLKVKVGDTIIDRWV
jgi:hypothetical protein